MSTTLLVLGALPDGADIAPFTDTTHDRNAQADAVAILSPIKSPAEIDTILARMRRPLAPIADFTGSDNFRRDIEASAPTVSIMAEVLPALHGLVESSRVTNALPRGADSAGLLCLGIAYTRKQVLKATWRPNRAETLWYPAIGAALLGRRILEDLANAGLLRRRFVHRLHFCNTCQSHRVHAFEACTECGSGFLHEVSVVHHFACGEQGPESRFLTGHELICPKCNKELRHFGVDYGRPGHVLLCRSCATEMSEPEVRFVCMDCGGSAQADQFETRDWFDYEISEEGIDAFLRQRLPAVTFDNFLEPHERAFGWREFRLLAMEAARLSDRYARPMTVVRLTLPNVDAMRHELGTATADEAISLIIDVLAEQLRETDFFTCSAEYELVAVLPETTAAQAQSVLDRVTARVKEIVAGHAQLRFALVDPKDAISVIEAVS